MQKPIYDVRCHFDILNENLIGTLNNLLRIAVCDTKHATVHPLCGICVSYNLYL